LRANESPQRSLPIVSPESSQGLCQTCALCCDGTIFSHVPIEPTEVASIRSVGLEVFDAENNAHFVQPCMKLENTSCSIYANRPETCRNFRCRVLRRLEVGELSTERAHSLVNQAKTLISALRDLLVSQGDPTRSIWKRLDELAKAESLQLESPEFSRRHSPLGMHAVVLQHLIDTEFRTTRRIERQDR
jgi:uncharacterized protein